LLTSPLATILGALIAFFGTVLGLIVALRRDRVDEIGFGQLVADLNEFMLRNGAHLDDSDVGLVNRYIKAARHFDLFG
jgi:hypothetical protein